MECLMTISGGMLCVMFHAVSLHVPKNTQTNTKSGLGWSRSDWDDVHAFSNVSIMHWFRADCVQLL